MLTQMNFDRSEEIADALHEQKGLEDALLSLLSDLLPPEKEGMIYALIDAQGHCRRRAMALAGHIARSGGDNDQPAYLS
ncbi:MAG: hypothetical protein CML69_10885 [Rhodobacteraceae bacterium]|nr:hypothetical protein [Paracoccaceae bacterium]